MVFQRLSRTLTEAFRRPAPTPPQRRDNAPIMPGCTIYAIGDIHGRVDLLDNLLERISLDIEELKLEPRDLALVFLGDYVDRGEDSIQVLHRLSEIWQQPPIPAHFIIGNHEEMMLDFIDEPVANRDWLSFGGLSTLMSYGVRGINATASEADCKRAAKELRAALKTHETFLREALVSHVQFGNIFLCHAGMDRTRPLDDQDERALLWGHDGFMEHGGPSDAWVIHGHTVRPEPDFGYNRVGIDTGAYHSGCLTAARIRNGSIKFLNTSNSVRKIPPRNRSR